MGMEVTNKMDKIGEQHGEFTIIAKSTKKAQGYLYYYFVKCSCGNIKRYRYDQIRKKKHCELCEDCKASNVLEGYMEAVKGGKHQ